ncbi:MAG: hypothetical protein VXX11_03470 [Planctomycetota bacterium]|nr:hypothetical protein [Planctomycetota bacterium]|tara:strand:- start:1855 stop:2100 length:246 start_codon:yes stop_codon:yes gene_type:complete
MTDFQLLVIRLQLLAKIEDDPMRRMILEEAVKAVTRLADENASLWDMLDEIHASDISHHHERIESAMAHLSSLLGDGGGDA